MHNFSQFFMSKQSRLKKNLKHRWIRLVLCCECLDVVFVGVLLTHSLSRWLTTETVLIEFDTELDYDLHWHFFISRKHTSKYITYFFYLFRKRNRHAFLAQLNYGKCLWINGTFLVFFSLELPIGQQSRSTRKHPNKHVIHRLYLA